MLSRVNRISRAADFRSTVRTGRKFPAAHAVVYVVGSNTVGSDVGEQGVPSRFGFIVSKAVGNSVVRHRVTRRLRAVAFELLPAHSSGLDVIVRALPGADAVAWTELRDEIAGSLSRYSQPRHAQSGARA